jgi:hypothetical protein
MKVSGLQRLLNDFDEDQEFGISIDFPDFKDWGVDTYDISFKVHEEDGCLLLNVAVYLSDFDYPSINRELKDLVKTIPEHACTPV